MDYIGSENAARTNAEQSETGGDFRVSFESWNGFGDDLYFIRIKGGPVKIGRSENVKKRLRMLQCASPYDLELVGIMRHGGCCETIFHNMLDAHRIRGEWFTWEGIVVEAVEAALGEECRWRTVFGIEEPGDIDWRIGSPLYEPVRC